MAPVSYDGPPSAPNTGKATRRSGAKWAVNRAIARKLKKLDCDPVAFLARLAEDEEAPLTLRYRAAARLAMLMHAPQADAPAPPQPKPEPVDIAASIAKFWEDD